MEYKDYKTGKPISREQYIKNGLERGELLLEEPCGCVVIQDRTADAYIAGCNIHEAAPDMYEALIKAKETIKAFHGEVAWDIYNEHSPEMKAINQAIAKAEANL